VFTRNLKSNEFLKRFMLYFIFSLSGIELLTTTVVVASVYRNTLLNIDIVTVFFYFYYNILLWMTNGLTARLKATYTTATYVQGNCLYNAPAYGYKIIKYSSWFHDKIIGKITTIGIWFSKQKTLFNNNYDCWFYVHFLNLSYSPSM